MLLRERCLSSLSERCPPPLSSTQTTMAGYCAEYGDGLSAGGYCSSFVAADSMVFVATKFADVREYELSLKILVLFGLFIVNLLTPKLYWILFIQFYLLDRELWRRKLAQVRICVVEVERLRI
jgi:hypothetical protein